MGERHGGDALGVRGLGVPQPPQLRRGERGDRHDAGAPGVLVGAHLVDQVARRLRRTGVVPEQGVADDAALGVEHDHAVLLPADRDGLDAVESAGVGERREQRAPPRGGIHLGAVGVRGTAGAHERPGRGIPDHDLARLRRRVDAGDERHGASSVRSPSPVPPLRSRMQELLGCLGVSTAVQRRVARICVSASRAARRSGGVRRGRVERTSGCRWMGGGGGAGPSRGRRAGARSRAAAGARSRRPCRRSTRRCRSPRTRSGRRGTRRRSRPRSASGTDSSGTRAASSASCTSGSARKAAARSFSSR